MQPNYVIVDNFCSNPEAVVASAYDAGFATWLPNKGEIGSSIYEGMGFWGLHALMLAPLTNAVRSVVVPNSMFFRVTNLTTEQAYIHSDREMGNYTCVAYLSQHDEPYGTAFFRHKATGLARMPSFEEMKSQGIMDQLKEDMVSRDMSKWEQVDYVEGQYNRALIFDAPLFHSRFPLTGIGDDDTDGRLVWASHFYKLKGNGQLF